MSFDEREESRALPQTFVVRLPGHNKSPGWSIQALRPGWIGVKLTQHYLNASDVEAFCASLKDSIETSKWIQINQPLPLFDEEKPIESLPPKELILEFFKKQPAPVTATYVMRGLQISHMTVVEIIKELIQEGIVEVAKKPSVFRPHSGRWGVRFRLVENLKEETSEKVFDIDSKE